MPLIWAFAILWLGFVLIRLRFRAVWANVPRQGRHGVRERVLTSAAAFSQLVPGLLWLSGDAMDVAAVGLPDAVRWFGFVIGLGALGLLYAVHRVLGANFSPRLELREAHTLVTAGPYRWVRHPMYTSGFLLCSAFGLVSANVVVGALPLLVLAVLVAVRLPDEEAMLAERFGTAFEAYRRQSGALTPWW